HRRQARSPALSPIPSCRAAVPTPAASCPRGRPGDRPYWGISPEPAGLASSPPLSANTVPRVAVGTALAGGPPRRSQRALLTHWAPALGAGVESHVRPGVRDPGLG